MKVKSKKVQGLGWSAFLSGIFGITEPAIYGITLPRKKVFAMNCIGAAVGGALMGIFGTKAYMVGGLGVFLLPLLPSYIGYAGIYMGFYGAIISWIVAFPVALGFSLVFGFNKEDLKVKRAVKEPVLNNEGPQLATATVASANYNNSHTRKS